jgi:hypothetical protein
MSRTMKKLPLEIMDFKDMVTDEYYDAKTRGGYFIFSPLCKVEAMF